MKRVVAIGGGTGLSVLLYGLKEFFKVSAVVSVGDNGGGSGILREDLNMLPPGDIRNCLLALSDAPDDLKKLLSYRFKEGNLKGQSLGNLIIAGMTKEEGSFEAGINLISSVLNLRGFVYPVTLEKMDLCATLSDGTLVCGESEIAILALKRHAKIKELALASDVKISNDVKSAIFNADFVTLGPGSLYTSVICNLLVGGMKEVLKDKKIIYISNVMTQIEETNGYGLKDHVLEVEKYLGRKVDYVFSNSLMPHDDTLKCYYNEGSIPVIADEKDKEFFKNRLIEGDFLEESHGYIRSDAINIAKRLEKLFGE